jgi:hypothetical protein
LSTELYHGLFTSSRFAGPDLREVEKEAKKKHRSLAQQAVITLAKGLDTLYNPKEKRSLLLDNLSRDKLNNKKYKLSDPVKIIREDRER